MASSSSASGSYPPPTPPKASLSSVPPVSPHLPTLVWFQCCHLLCLKFRFISFSQELRSNLTIPVDDKHGLVCLGPMGDSDPNEMINFETSRIPFKNASLDLADWDSYFRSWTGYTKGWRNWYRRVSKKNKDL
jgi:hypothetical protein